MNKKGIFNFISNSYSQFLNYCYTTSTHSASSFSEIYPEIDIYDQIYALKKRHARIYQGIFIALSVLFFALAAIVFYNTTNWACSIVFKNCAFVKACTYSICFIFSTVTFMISFLIKPERETVHYLVQRMETYLKNLYKHQKNEIELIFSPHPDKRQAMALYQQSFYQALTAMRERKEYALYQLEKISYSSHQTESKENQFNQVLQDLQSRLNGFLQGFKQKSYYIVTHFHEPHQLEQF